MQRSGLFYFLSSVLIYVLPFNAIFCSLVILVEESDIVELEKRYWNFKSKSNSGRLDLTTLVPLVSPPVPLSVCPGIFSAFDENRDNHIDFKEMACGISAACRGPLTERLKCKCFCPQSLFFIF